MIHEKEPWIQEKMKMIQEALLVSFIINIDSRLFYALKFILGNKEVNLIPKGLTYDDFYSRLDEAKIKADSEYGQALEDVKDE